MRIAVGGIEALTWWVLGRPAVRLLVGSQNGTDEGVWALRLPT